MVGRLWGCLQQGLRAPIVPQDDRSDHTPEYLLRCLCCNGTPMLTVYHLQPDGKRVMFNPVCHQHWDRTYTVCTVVRNPNAPPCKAQVHSHAAIRPSRYFGGMVRKGGRQCDVGDEMMRSRDEKFCNRIGVDIPFDDVSFFSSRLF